MKKQNSMKKSKAAKPPKKEEVCFDKEKMDMKFEIETLRAKELLISQQAASLKRKTVEDLQDLNQKVDEKD